MDAELHNQIEVPESQQVGVHADFALVWHTPESFVIDFASVTKPPERGETETGQPVIVQDAQVAARVRLAPTHVFELMKALEQQLSSWEAETGNGPRTAAE